MIQSPRRFALTLLSLFAFLAAGTGDVLVRHPCPHHDALPGQNHHVEASRFDHHHVAPQASVDAAATEADENDAAPEEKGGCTCLGQCQLRDAPTAPPVAVAVVHDLEAPVAAAPSAPHAAPRRAPTPHRLHLPNAPPLSV